MVATSGDLLLEESAISTLKTELLPLADVITPNLPEGATLTGSPVPTTSSEMDQMVEKLRALGCSSVLLKGGHLESDNDSNDLLIFAESVETLSAKRVDTKNTHGTGCTLSSAIASYLAQGHDLISATTLAKSYISQAIKHSDELDIGKGHGPVHHFFSGHADVR